MADTDEIGQLISERRVVREVANPAFVNARLKQAHDNVKSAEQLSQANPLASITIAYDALRFAVDAHMQANGLRVANGPGAHRAAGVYARIRMIDILERDDISTYEALRSVRNSIEYPNSSARIATDGADAAEIAEVAKRVVAAVTRWWIEENKRSS